MWEAPKGWSRIKIDQASEPTQSAVDELDALIVLLPESALEGPWPTLPYAEVLRQRSERTRKKGCNAPLIVADLPNAHGTRVAVACLRDCSAFELLGLARKLAAGALEVEPQRIGIAAPDVEALLAGRAATAMLAALLAARAPMPRFSRDTEPPDRLKGLSLLGVAIPDVGRLRAEAEGNALARQLTVLPPSELTPAQYRKRALALAEQHGWEAEFLDAKALARKKAGAFLAVAQGSPEPDAGLLRLSYRPRGSARRKAIALVGKGICFDTGGVNLKPARHMLGMHEDMQGSAVALGTLLALSRLRAGIAVDCWLALAQNHVGPHAYKPNDVVTAANGTTIEVIHTDAEGRMVLADALALAARRKPALILDYATLTGACIQALGTRYAGAFCNREDLLPLLVEAGRASGERVWPFPLDADYDEALESTVADVKQCSIENEADHILAARFLSRFVPADIPWVHFDLAAGSHKGGLAHMPTDVTGFGVHYTLELLLGQRLLERF